MEAEHRKKRNKRKLNNRLKIAWREERYSVLLASVFIYVLLSALLPERTWSTLLMDGVFFILVLSVVFEVVHFRSLFTLLGILGCLAVGGHVIAFLWKGENGSRIILAVSSILFIAAAIFRVSRRVMGASVVTGDTIQGAIVIYLLIGALFSSIYILIEIVFPGSFLITNSAGKNVTLTVGGISRFFGYFSMVTLTTLGYGDVIPVRDLSRSMTWVEAFFGQIYLAVTIARLVGIYIAQKTKNK